MSDPDATPRHVAERDPLGEVLAGIVIGSASGGAAACAALLAAGGGLGAPAPSAAPVVLGGVSSLALGGSVAWRLSRHLGSPWRRAQVAMIGVMGTTLVDILTVPAHLAAGRWGLAALGGLCLAGIMVGRRVLRAPGR